MRMLLLVLCVAVGGGAASSPYQLKGEALEQFKQTRYREAEAGFRLAYDAWRQAGPGFERDRAITTLNLGTVLRIEARYAEAEPLLVAALRELEATTGAGSLDTGRAAIALASLYQAWGRPVDAEPTAKRAWEILLSEPNATESDRAGAELLLAAVYFDSGRGNAGEALLKEMPLDAETRLVLRAYNDLGAAAIQRSDLESAESFVQRALEMSSRVKPESHPLRAAALNNLGQIRRFQKRYLEAEQNYHQAIAIWEATLGPRHPETAKGMLNLAALHHERGREAAAEELYRRAASIFHDVYGDSYELTLIARGELAEVLRAQRRFRESESLMLSILPALEGRLGSADPRVVRAVGNYQRLVQETRR